MRVVVKMRRFGGGGCRFSGSGKCGSSLWRLCIVNILFVVRFELVRRCLGSEGINERRVNLKEYRVFNNFDYSI